MIARMAADHDIDSRRIYVTGLSAGGAMTSVMLATYPEMFAGGAVIAGLPFGIAGNVREALSGMMASPPRPANELGDLVRNASGHKGPWPKLSVWHGSADRTVNPANADEIVKQWLDVHGLPLAPMSAGDVDGYPREVWWNADGETVIESYTITDMAHGTPLGDSGHDERFGEAGAFLIEAGISSSYHIANFFGLTEQIHQPKTAAKTNNLKTCFKGRFRGRLQGHCQGRLDGDFARACRHHCDDGAGACAGTGSRHDPVAAREAGPTPSRRTARAAAASMSARSSPAR